MNELALNLLALALTPYVFLFLTLLFFLDSERLSARVA